MTAPHGLSAERLRIGQRVVTVVEHTALCCSLNAMNYPIRQYPGELGTVDYFWSDGRFVVTWTRNPSTPVAYDVGAWPKLVTTAPEGVVDTRPVAPDARETTWDAAIDNYFDGRWTSGGKP